MEMGRKFGAAEMMQTAEVRPAHSSTTPPSLGGREVLVGVWFVKLMKNGTSGSYICEIYTGLNDPRVVARGIIRGLSEPCAGF